MSDPAEYMNTEIFRINRRGKKVHEMLTRFLWLRQNGSTASAFLPNRIEVVRQQFSLPNLTRRLRIVALSDLHAPSCSHLIPKVVSLANQQSPDIFVLAGDIIDESGNENMVEMFETVEANFAKVAVLGNWEYFSKLDLSMLRKRYGSAGITLLVNSSIDLPELTIVGLDDFLLGCPDYGILRHASSNGCPILAISHCPKEFIFMSSLSRVPMLTLSGHTHGGQIAPLGWAPFTPPGSGSYVRGWYRNGKHSMYVMRGVGTTVIPIRIGARPELLVLDIKPE
jgi:predicted MPP superfamily phosphohydrolase